MDSIKNIFLYRKFGSERKLSYRLLRLSAFFVFLLFVGVVSVEGVAWADGETVDSIFITDGTYSGPSKDITVKDYVSAGGSGVVDITVRSVGLGDGTSSGNPYHGSNGYASVFAESATIKIEGSCEDSSISTVKSGAGNVYGVYTSGTGGVSIRDVGEITASGEGVNLPGMSATKAGVCTYSDGTLDVTNVDKISGEQSSSSKKGDAIGVWARESLDGDNSTVTLTNVQEIEAKVSNNNSVSYGINIEDNGIVNLNNVDTVTASGGNTTYSAYVADGGRLNVSADTKTTFNGDVYNAGTIVGENMVVNGTVENNAGNVAFKNLKVYMDNNVDEATAGINATGGTTSVDGGEILAKNKAENIEWFNESASGVSVENGAVVDIKDIDVISADAVSGAVIGVTVTGSDSHATITGTGSISATGSGATGGVSVNYGTADISGFDTISAVSKGDGQMTASGIDVELNGTLTVTNVGTITATGGTLANHSAYVGDDSTLNVRTNTKTTFNGDVLNNGTFNINSGDIDINGSVANNSNFNINGGITTISGDLTGTGTTSVSQDATLVLKNSTVSQQTINNDGTLHVASASGDIKGTLTNTGTIDLSDENHTVGTKLYVDNFYGSGDNSKINFDIDIRGTSEDTDSIIVNTEASGDIALGNINIAVDDDLDVYETKTLKLFTDNADIDGAADFSKLNITGTATTVTSAGYKYEFRQDEEDKGNIVATKVYGYTLPEIIQNNPTGSGVISAYSLVDDYTVPADLGTLTRMSSETPREFTIYGNGFCFNGNNYAGITVSSGNTLNIYTIEASGFNGNLVTNNGTLNMKDVWIVNSLSNSGTLNFERGENNITGDITNSGNINVSGDLTTISGDLTGTGSADIANGATLALKNSNVSLSSNITNSGTLNFAEGTNTLKNTKITENGITSVSKDASLAVSNSTILQNLNNEGTLTGDNVTINGDVTNSGTININSGTTTVNGSVDLKNSAENGTVIKDGANLVIAEQDEKSVTFSDIENSFIMNNGSSFTVDAFNGNILNNDFSLIAGVGEAISADVNAAIGLRLAKTGAELKEYYATQYKNVQDAIYGEDTEGALSFINGKLIFDTGEKPVLKVNTGGIATVRTEDGFDVVNDNDNSTVRIKKEYSSKPVEVVQDGAGIPTLQAVKGVDFTGDVTLEAKQIKVKNSDGAEAVTLTVKGGSTLNLTGGENVTDALVIDENNKAVATDLVVEEGNIGVATYEHSTTDQQGTLRNVTVNKGTHTLGVSSGLANTPQTNYVYEHLDINNEGSQVKVLNSSLTVNELKAKGGTLFVDPSYVAFENVANNTISTDLLVSKGSVVNIGGLNADELKTIVSNDAGMTVTAKLSGFTVADDKTVLALNDNYTLANSTSLIVDADVQFDGTDKNSDADVYFGKKSLLVVNGEKAVEKAALQLTNQKVEVAEGAKLHVTRAKDGQKYTVFNGAVDTTADDIAGWQGDNLLISKLLTYTIDNTGEHFIIDVAKGYDASKFTDTIPYNSIKAMADMDLVNTDADITTSGGIRFLSRATDTNYINTSDMKPTLDEVSTLAAVAGVQHSALRTTDTMTDAVAEHLSNTLHANGSEIHNGDTTDVWATPFYRSMSWSGGRNDVSGYMSGFSFGMDKSAGANARIGLAMHYGSGSTEGESTKTDTKNSSRAVGVSLYGSKQLDKVNLIGQIGYTDYDNSMSSYLPSKLSMPAVSTSPSATTFTADVKAEQPIKAGDVDITPHAGVRYTRVMTDSFKNYITETESDSQNIFQFPVGVTFGVQHEASDDWKLKGTLDLSVVPVAGNRDAHTKVMFAGINGIWNEADTAILDSCSFRGSLGFTAERKYFSSNLGYALQKSSNETNHTFRLWLNWKLK